MAELKLHPLGYEVAEIPPTRFYRSPQILREHDEEKKWIIVIPPASEAISALVVDPAGDLIWYYCEPDEEYMHFDTPNSALSYLEANWRRLAKMEMQPEFELDPPAGGEKQTRSASVRS